HIVPDFAVETDGTRINLILLNDIPELQIEQSFSDDSIARAGEASRNKREVVSFMRQQRDEARDFIKVLKTRQATLFRVMQAIVGLQRDFFLTEDMGKIRPMILKDVAAVTGDDLSVISRATASKYVATSRGVYPIKMFFNEHTKTDDDTSSHKILVAMREIIEKEDKHKPLSDEVITSLLNNEGYSLARRTVAKYRERLGIPVARLRKEL
ncbi:MAG: RNA polymerase sigma-54 factor, partial [Muribaculaceae bacterium]|nr:RNA polymerase sigma-54 factor [Muribaculaceae bacterium]